MKRVMASIVVLSVWMMGLIACGQPTAVPATPRPTLAVSAEESGAVVGGTTAVPTLTEPIITDAPPATATAVPPTPAIPEPTIENRAYLLIHPLDGSDVPVGQPLRVAGVVPNDGQGEVRIELVAGQHVLATAVATVDANGDWETELDVPRQIRGAATLSTSYQNDVKQATLELVSGVDATASQIVLSRPAAGEMAVAGAPLFFSGDVQGAQNQTITIGFMVDGCTRFVAQQSFTLAAADAPWTGLLLLPQVLPGDSGCAVAYTGTYDGAGWRAFIRPLPIYQADDEAVDNLFVLGNRLDTPLRGGQAITLYGAALNVPGTTAELRWLLPDNETSAIGSALIDSFGYWEVTTAVPSGVASLQLEIVVANDSDSASTQFEIPIVP